MPAGKLVQITKNRYPGISRRKVKTIKKIARDVAMTIPEIKHFGFIDENIQLIHNKVNYLDNFLKCKQGIQDPDNPPADGQLARIGDELYLRSINIKLWLSNKADRPNCMYRVILFWYDTAETLNDALCFFTQQNKMLDRPNNENISIIDDQYIFSRSSYTTTTREHSYLCTVKGKWKKKKITYDEGGSDPKKRTIGLITVAYDAFGTLQSDEIASFAYNASIGIQDP